MKYDPDRHHRRSIRLKGYDYAQAGAYLVTICCLKRECLLGEVVDGVMRPNEAGRVVQTVWEELPVRFPVISLDAFVVMPNHIHGIILVGAQFIAPTNDVMTHAPTGKPGLGEMVRAFKAVSTRLIRKTAMPTFAWQRNYYEHIVRDEERLHRLRRYIEENPQGWGLDRENPATQGLDSGELKHPPVNFCQGEHAV